MLCSRIFEQNNQKGIPWKLGQGEPLILHATHCLHVIHIPIKLHEDIMNGEWVMEGTRMLITHNNMFLKGYPLEAKTAPKN